MYWMEEFMDEWDNNDDYGSFGGMPFMGGGYPSMMPYGAPMGYGTAPMPMQMPYAPMGAPNMAPMQQMPMMAAPAMQMPSMPTAPSVPPMPTVPAVPGAAPGPAAQTN